MGTLAVVTRPLALCQCNRVAELCRVFAGQAGGARRGGAGERCGGTRDDQHKQ